MQTLAIAAFAAVALIVSAVADRKKTVAALHVAWRRFLSLVPSFLAMLTIVSLVFAVISRETIVRYLGQDSLVAASAIAAGLGSISLMPGFIAFPLAGILVDNGVARMVIAAFTTTLMMVGVVTYPIEKQYFGARVAILRNVLSLVVAAAVSIVVGIFFGEIR